MEDNRYSFNSNELLFKVFHYKKPLLITTTIGAIVAIIVSFLITPLYRSTFVLYPAPSLAISESIKTKDVAKKESIYGEDKETEQILQVLNSDELRTRIINKYDLWKHYDIDSANVRYPNDKMLKKFQKRISYRRTEYMAVEISVLDADPDTAAMIANDIATLIDTVMNGMEHTRAKEVLNIVEYEYKTKEEQISDFNDSLKRIMEKGIYDYESQSEVVVEAYAQALASGNTKGAERIKEQLDTLAKYGAAYVSLRDFLEFESEQLSALNQKYKEAKVDAEQLLTHYFVVNKAIKSDKKAKPKRAIIVGISTIATFIFTFIVLIFIELLKEFKLQEEAKNQSKE
ncbi:MAG: Wzz/FepE/Etk N-terminal domain-containing protein [Bacteroidales bacterium]|nr:Wzz/FepE/Etk N-terminal domain-containing protein [Bacteroidales bacterium]